MIAHLIHEWVEGIGGKFEDPGPDAGRYWFNLLVIFQFVYGAHRFRWVVKRDFSSYLWCMDSFYPREPCFTLSDCKVTFNQPDMFEKIHSFLNNPHKE